jgi:hypothetical protein
VFPGADAGYMGCIEKGSQSEARREHFWCILCEKSRFYAKNHIFSNFRGVPDAPPPFESATGSGSDNNST